MKMTQKERAFSAEKMKPTLAALDSDGSLDLIVIRDGKIVRVEVTTK
ncbi:MAG: hypothetical protein WC712_05775 [Candidatus Brocadiia bacterium]